MLKASNPDISDRLGQAYQNDDVLAISDEFTIAVGAYAEQSASVGINGDSSNNDVQNAGAVYVYGPSATADSKLTPQNIAVETEVLSNDVFPSVFLDASSLAVALDPNNGTAVASGGDITYTPSNDFFGVDQFDYEVCDLYTPILCLRGKATVTTVAPTVIPLSQAEYLRASNSDLNDRFGEAVSISNDGNVMAVVGAGAVYIYVRDGLSWSKEALIKAKSTEAGDWYSVVFPSFVRAGSKNF